MKRLEKIGFLQGLQRSRWCKPPYIGEKALHHPPVKRRRKNQRQRWLFW
ncbi:MAG: hypothetical protein NHB32_13370 [Fischerella sp. CENA71]|nr:hypothetical protein [Fischerella sp. CENA71]